MRPNLSPYPFRTVPYRTVSYRIVPYRTVSYRTVPSRTVAYRTVFRFPLYRKFLKIVYRTVLFSAFIAKTANRAVRKGNYFLFFTYCTKVKIVFVTQRKA